MITGNIVNNSLEGMKPSYSKAESIMEILFILRVNMAVFLLAVLH